MRSEEKSKENENLGETVQSLSANYEELKIRYRDAVDEISDLRAANSSLEERLSQMENRIERETEKVQNVLDFSSELKDNHAGDKASAVRLVVRFVN